MDNKIKVIFFFRKPRPQYFSIEKVFDLIISNLPDKIEAKIYKLKSGSTGMVQRIKALIEARKNKGEINHITGDVTFLALALPSKRLVITYHDLESMINYKGFRLLLMKYFWIKYPVNKAEIITVISEHTKNKLIELTGVDEKKIVVIPNPLPEEIKYTPKDFNKNKPVILVMGTKANKNVERIMQALQGINCRLLIVGKMTEEQCNLANELNLETENLVHVPYSDIVNAYQKCDMLCFPSLYEGFGMPIIEAQATGRPVITSNYGAMKEVAGEGALLVDPNSVNEIREAVLKVMNDKKFRDELIRKGVGNVKKYRAKEVGNRYGEIYSGL